jgi:chromosome segregation ATPase
MTSLAGVKAILDAKRKEIEEANLAKKDLNATVADKNTKIEGLTAANTTLEGERTELTRKRDELAAQLTDANSKKDGAVAELTTVKEDLVRATEKAAGMFTKEQLAEIEAKATKAEELAAALRGKYTALHAWAARAAENNAPGGFQRDPFGEPAKEGDAPTAVAVSVEAATDSVLTNVLALDAKSGIVAFSVGEANGIKEKAVFDVKVDGKKIGKVQISSVKGSLSYGQLQPDKDLDLGAIAKAASVSLVPSTKLASK